MAVPGAGRDDLDLAAGTVVADGVVTEVLAQLIQQAPAARHGGALAEVGQGDVRAAGVDLLALHTLLGHIQKIDRLHGGGSPRLADVVEVRELENIVDQLDHPAGLYMDLVGKIRGVFGLSDPGLDQLGIAGNAGQRRLQLVADVGRELLPHLLVVFPQHPVGMDALRKGDQLFVGNILLNVVKVVGHLQHGLNEALSQQPSDDGGGTHHQKAAQNDGGQGSIIDGPDGLGVLRHTEDVPVGQQHGVIISLIAHRLGVAAVTADAALHGLLDLRAAQMVLHRLIRRRLEEHAAVRRDKGDAQRAVHISLQLAGVIHLCAPGSHEIGLPLEGCPRLRTESLVEHKNAERSGAQQAGKAHQKQQIAYFFFHAAWFHCSSSSSLSVSL